MPERIGVHEKSCAKSQKRRPVFNSAKHRAVEGQPEIPGKRTGAKTTVPKTTTKATTEGGEKKQKWKRQHEEFINAIKASKMISKIEKEGGDIRSVPVIPS